MITKAISQIEKTRVIAKSICIDYVEEILGCLTAMEKDINTENAQHFDVWANLFIGTVENELKVSDRITMYTYTRSHCLEILDNRKHTHQLRLVVHTCCAELEKRIVQLDRHYKRTGKYALRKAYERIIKDEYATGRPSYPTIDRAILLIKDLDKE